MPLPAPHLRLCCFAFSAPLRCETSLSTTRLALTIPHSGVVHSPAQQRRVFRSSAPLKSPTTAARPRSRGHPQQCLPLLVQCSQLVHHTHRPVTCSPSKTTIMATQLQTNLDQTREHMGLSHGHDHHHHHDTRYLTSKNKRDPGVRITRIGLYINLGMAIAKGAGGYVFNSQA